MALRLEQPEFATCYVYAMAPVSLKRIMALSCASLLLCAGAAVAGHMHDEDAEAKHHCAWCTTRPLSLFHDNSIASSSFPSADGPLLPAIQGQPLCALYPGWVLSRAPPVPA